MTKKHTKLVLSLILVAGIVATALTFGNVSAQGPTNTPTATSTTNAKLAPATATATTAANSATNTPVSKVAPATATATLTKPAATATVKAATATPTKTATRTPTKPLQRVGKSPSFFFTYQSGFQIQNLAATLANISMTFYGQDGTVAATVTDTVSASSSKTYFPVPGVSGGFNGSTIISSDQPLASIVNTLGSGATNADDSYNGSSGGATSVFMPLLMKGNSGINTWFNVQNTGGIATTVFITYSDGTTVNRLINPGAAQTFDQSSETHSATVFSGKATASQPIAMVVMEENSTTLSTYSAFTSSSTNPVMPLVNVQPSQNIISGAQIQNNGGSPTNVTVTYKNLAGSTVCTETQTIAASQSKTFVLGAFASGANSTCTGGSTFVGSGVVTTNSAAQPLNIIVNQAKIGVNAGAYDGFDPASATNKTVMPLIMDRNGGSLGLYTAFSVMNTSTSSSTNVTCTFSGTGFTIGPTAVAAGASLVAIQSGAISPGYVGSGTCTASGGSENKIVAIVNEAATGGTGDLLLVYGGVNQ